ncbi:MAG: glycosyltransferase 61 family protein, partial [Microcoleaceae cyanobacterium]
LLQKQGRIDDEIDIYKKMIEIVPNRCAYYDELGQLLMQKEQWEDAIATFVKALQIQPDYSLAIYDNIAKALEKLGFDDDAYGCYLNKQLSDYVIQIYCQLSDDLLTTSQTHPSLTHIDIYPANLLDLSPSKKISDSALSETQTPTEQSLLSVGVDGKIGWDLMTTAIAPETFVVVVPEGRAWGDAVTSAIITTDNKLVINVSTKGNAELIISSDKLIPPELINGTVAFLSVKWGGLGYFHWMLDLIARIHLLYQSGFTLDKIDKFVVNSYDKPYQKETLTLLGIPPEKIIDSSHCHHIKAQTLVVPSLQFQGIYKLCNWACDFLKESFLNEQVTPNTRIYISREAPYPRKISNNDEVSQYLETLGFEKVLLETMSVGEQALCLASAEIVVAPHGAGLTNLVFCHPGTKVIEIFSPLYMPPEYWLLSNVCGLEHFSCIGELLDKHASCYDVYQDIFVNLEQLQELLTMAGIVNG